MIDKLYVQGPSVLLSENFTCTSKIFTRASLTSLLGWSFWKCLTSSDTISFVCQTSEMSNVSSLQMELKTLKFSFCYYISNVINKFMLFFFPGCFNTTDSVLSSISENSFSSSFQKLTSTQWTFKYSSSNGWSQEI